MAAGSHLETRVIALLKKIERSRNPNAIQIRPGRKSKKGGTMPTPPEKKPRRAASNKRRRTKSDPELHKVRPKGLHQIAPRSHYAAAFLKVNI